MERRQQPQLPRQLRRGDQLLRPDRKDLAVGRDATIAHIAAIYSNPHIMRSEYLNPVVHISDGGDFAVLAYNLNTYVLDDNGNERQLRALERHSNPSGAWYWGNFYHVADSGNPAWFNRGWILKSHLRYIRCW